MVWIILGLLALYIYLLFNNHKSEENKDAEIKNLEKKVQHLQDTLDHYGIRMSNKVPDENKYYKRGRK